MNRVIGFSGVDLDLRTPKSRMEETNFGSFAADMVRAELGTDFAMIGGGCLRMDEIVPAGELKAEFLHKLLPFPDEAWTLELSGQTFYEALENSVSKWPSHEGRFP